MSIEKKIETACTLIKEILLELAKPATGKAGKDEGTSGEKRGPGRPKKTPPPPVEDDLGGDDELEGDDDLDGDGLEEEEETGYDFKTVRSAIVQLRDHGGEKANTDDVKRVMKKFEISNFNELQDAEQSTLNEVMAFIMQLAAKKKLKIKV